MKIKFCGAAQEVTGSQHLLTINNKNFLLDCGFKQTNSDSDLIYNRNFLFDPEMLDAVLLSHAHLDHCGNIPNLYKQGFKGSVYCTKPTKDLSRLIALDAAKLQAQAAAQIYKVYGTITEPIYKDTDVEYAWKNVIGVKYYEELQLDKNIQAEFHNAGHILGSGQIVLKFKDEDDGQNKTLLFTGDYGRRFMPLLQDPDIYTEAEYLICESTYGNGVHTDISTVFDDFVWLIKDVYERGGKVLIPAFALERTQELLYILHWLMEQGRLPKIPIFVDSPLANQMVEVYEDYKEYFDEESRQEFYKRGKNPFKAEYINYIEGIEESKMLNGYKGQAIIIAGSGMLSGGRMIFHFMHHLPNSKNLVLVVGFMAGETLGKQLLEQPSDLMIFKELVPVKAQIESLDSLSGHADKLDLLNYIEKMPKLKKVFLVHGQPEKMEVLRAEILKLKPGTEVLMPVLGEEIKI
ncbi:MAG TPA: MBL fold metallo-hydrolase [bacterium]|nr:MBL fold metallo-hydrolase [bacterium]